MIVAAGAFLILTAVASLVGLLLSIYQIMVEDSESRSRSAKFSLLDLRPAEDGKGYTAILLVTRFRDGEWVETEEAYKTEAAFVWYGRHGDRLPMCESDRLRDIVRSRNLWGGGK